MVLIGPTSYGGVAAPSVWLVSYTMCSFAATISSNALTFYAELDSVNGTVVSTGSGLQQCAVLPGGTPPVGTALSISTPAEASIGTSYWYNFSILSAAGSLTMENVGLDVETPVGAEVPISGAWTLTVFDVSGAPVASYSMTTGQWLSGGSVTVNAGQFISLGTPVSLSGDRLVALGMGAFSGSVFASIP
jgi:hypothetical protein